MLHVADFEAALGVANPGDGRAGEVEGVFVEVEDDFDYVGIHDVGGGFDRGGDGGDGGFGVFEEGFDGGVDGGGVEEGLVALDIDEDLACDVGGDFGDALGASAMVGAGHASFAAEGCDGLDNAVVIGGDDDLIDRFGGLGAVVDALNHGLAGEHDQRLAGETRRTVPRWYYHYDFPRTHRCDLSRRMLPQHRSSLFEVGYRAGSSK